MIQENVKKILGELPGNVTLVAATKSRSAQEIRQALEAGVTALGENYVQEAQGKFEQLGRIAQWHCIGHLQKNKVKKAVRIFDIIETLDSFDLAKELDKECAKIGKLMPVLIEVNSADEQNKHGAAPEQVESLVVQARGLKNIKLSGLMTMGPVSDNPEDSRLYFKKTREIFDAIKHKYPAGIDWRYLSMGMSGSFRVAIEEGANIVRIGSLIFGQTYENKNYLR